MDTEQQLYTLKIENIATAVIVTALRHLGLFIGHDSNNKYFCLQGGLKNSKVAILNLIMNHMENRPQRFEDAELQALLDEDSTQMQEKLAKQLHVSQDAVSQRLNSL
ncbi:CNOT6L [Cordylochernes scorpioides]|uniref:CNOT6L n=1 Tax=Cordylochernes scorpioides TaxID=51811 RepID=A0ABY6L0L5_9ARAC|nr:CNOT6L [Cordylochernes scorpioides]